MISSSIMSHVIASNHAAALEEPSDHESEKKPNHGNGTISDSETHEIEEVHDRLRDTGPLQSPPSVHRVQVAGDDEEIIS